MKGIILGLSVLLILVQNGFAYTDKEFDKKISEQTTEVYKQMWRCNKASMNHMRTANVDICLKAIKLIKKNPNKVGKDDISVIYGNTGLLYDESTGDKLKAYEYYMKASRMGSINAQKNLNIMCKQSSWACK